MTFSTVSALNSMGPRSRDLHSTTAAQEVVPEAPVDGKLRTQLVLLQPVLRRASEQAGWYSEAAKIQLPRPASAEVVADLTMQKQVAQRAQEDLRLMVDRLSGQIGVLPYAEDGTPPMEATNVDATGLVWGSHSDFIDQVSALLGVLKTEWLSKYQDALATYVEFYTKFSDIMEKIVPVGTGDKGDVFINFSSAYRELQKLMDEYGLTENALASFGSEAEAKAFVESLGLPGMTVVPGTNGSFHVMMDLSAVKDLRNSMGGGGGVTWDSARYNAWVSSKDSNLEQIKYVSRVLGEKLSEMTQKFDNIVKILSSTIDKFKEVSMSFIHGLP